MCTAMPNRFVRNPVSNMYALSAVVFGGPALCKRGVHKHCCLKVSAFAVGWCRCCLFPVAPARFPCVFFSVVFACGGGLLGLGEGHQAFKSTKIAHTSWRISILFFVYNVLTSSLGNTTSPPAHPGTPTQGFSETHPVFPTSHWITHRGARIHDHKVKGLALYRLS